MNPLTNVKNIQKLNKTELELGVPIERSWHQQYKDSAWIFIGGLSYDLTEGDVICVFSQFGEIANLNLIRDHKTGKSKGFGFLCYEDQRSTILAVDNLNGIKLTSRTIRVDHVEEYKVPKMREDLDPEKQKLIMEGCAPQLLPKRENEIEKVVTVKKETIIKKEPTLENSTTNKIKMKKYKKEKIKKEKKLKKRHSSSSSSSSDSSSSSSSSDDERKRKKRKKEKKKISRSRS